VAQGVRTSSEIAINEKMKKRKIHKDKNGREFIKESYFVGGKMKFNRIYVIDGIPADEFYEKNATDWDFYLNGDYELIRSEDYSIKKSNEQEKIESDSPKNEDLNDLPF
jgi:putative NIF3 family GTP cyclohydrolase 1 type 2